MAGSRQVVPLAKLTSEYQRSLLKNPHELRHGSRFLRDLPYPLPADLPEIHRQNLRTPWGQRLLRRLLVKPSLSSTALLQPQLFRLPLRQPPLRSLTDRSKLPQLHPRSLTDKSKPRHPRLRSPTDRSKLLKPLRSLTARSKPLKLLRAPTAKSSLPPRPLLLQPAVLLPLASPAEPALSLRVPPKLLSLDSAWPWSCSCRRQVGPYE
jgi:hypothetical protein